MRIKPLTQAAISAALESNLTSEMAESWCVERGLDEDSTKAFLTLVMGRKMIELMPEKAKMEQYNAALKYLLNQIK